MTKKLGQEDSKRKCDILNSFIIAYKRQHPYLSSNQIAMKLEIPQATLNRIENGVTNPSLENIINIMVGTGNESYLADVLGKCFPDQKERFDHIFSGNSEVPMMDKVSSSFATSEETFLIIQMAFTRAGVNEREIRERFGSYGWERVEEMLRQKVLIRDDSGVIRADCDRINVTFSDLKKLVCLAVQKCYDSESGFLSYQTESVNENGFRLIFQELKRSQAQIRKIMYNPDYFGDRRVFVGMVSDGLVRNENSDSEKVHGDLQ